MFGWLKNRVEEAVAQVNPFDGGKTAATVRAARPKRQPARIPYKTGFEPQRAPASTRPSYGNNVAEKLWNSARDVFDANTEQDKWKRNQQALQNWNAPMKLPTLDETYEQEQQRKTQEAIQDDKQRGALEQIGTNVVGGAAEFFGKIPGAIADQFADPMRDKKWTNLVSDPITSTTTQLAYAQDFLKDKLFGEEAPDVSEVNAKRVQDAARDFDEQVDSKIQQSRFGRRETDNQLLAGGSRATGQVLGQAGLTYADKGRTLLGSTIPALQTATAETRAAQDAGKSYEDARDIGILQGAVQGATEKMGLDKLKFPGGSNFITKAGSRFITEGAQEGGQEFLSNLVRQQTYRPDQNLMEGVKESALFGGIAGSAGGAVFDIPSVFNNQSLDPDTQAVRDKAVVGYNAAIDAGKPHTAQRFAQEIRAIDVKNNATTKLVDRVRNKLTPLNEGGYVQNPFGREGITDGLSEQQSEFINEYANMLKDMGQDNGVSITPDGQRVSNNYRTADIKGKNMTEADWFNKAREEIESGKAAYGASEDYQALPGLEQTTPETFTQPQKPEGFILKETPMKSGRQETVRIKKGEQGLERSVQTEYSPEVLSYAETFNVTPEQAFSDLRQNELTKAQVAEDAQRIRELGEKSDNIAKDIKDQEDYGALEIRDKPTATLDDALGGMIAAPELDPNLEQNRRTSGYKKFRDSLGKLNPLRAAEQGVDAALVSANNSGGQAGRAIARTAQYVYNKQAGQSKDTIKALQDYAGEQTYSTAAIHQVFGDIYKNNLQSEESRARVHEILDPEGTETNLKYEDLSPTEQQAADKLRVISDAINDTSYRSGMIKKAVWQKNRGGRYIARMYNEIRTAEDVTEMLDIPEAKGIFTGMYKSRVEMNEDMRQRLVRDPAKLVAIRARQAAMNEALMNYFTSAEKQGFVSQKPRKGFVKVPYGKQYLNWEGKYVKQDVFENINGFTSSNKMANALNNALDLYDGWTPRRIRKKLLTLYNPVVRTGNVTSNYFFAWLNGVNPVTYQKNKGRAKKIVQTLNDPLSKKLRKSGLLHSGIVSSDPNLFDQQKQFQSELEQSGKTGVKNWMSKKKRRGEQRYGEADDIAKTAAVLSHIDRGMSVDQAIEKTRRGFQDYDRVGKLYDLSAKMPVFGNAFVRFQGDLYMNIMKNAAVDHPLRVAALPYAVLALGNGLSALSGEDEEDKKTREERPGAASIPFSRLLPGTDRNVSLEFQMPTLDSVKSFATGGDKREAAGAFDAARFTPLYLRQGIDKATTAGDLSRVLPFNIPESNTKQGWAAAAASDPLLGPGISLLTDTDWRGKSVADPDGIRNGEEIYPDEPLSTGDKNRNRAQYALRSYLPYPFNEIGDINAAVNEDKKNEQTDKRPEGAGYNTAGSLKSPLQALARLGGVRAQKFGKEEAQQSRDIDRYYEKVDKEKEIIASLPSATRKAYDSLHNYTKKRSGAIEFDEDLRYTMKRASAWLSDPKLVETERRMAQLDAKYDNKPLHPKWSLKPKQLEAVIRGETFNPGEGTDTKVAQLYSQQWYDNYQRKLNPYYDKLAAWSKSKGYEPYKPKYKYPEGSKEVAQMANEYYDITDDSINKSDILRANPALAKLLADRKEYTNKKRIDLGLEPQENYYAKFVGGKYLGWDGEMDSGGRNYSRYSGGYRRSGGRRSYSRGGSRRGGSTKGKFDYKLYGFGSKSGTASKSLRKLIEEATIS